MRPFSFYNKNLKGSFAMKIIDSHLHLCQTEGFCRTAAFAHCENSMVYVQKEFAKNNIVMGIGMGNQPFDTKDTAPLVCNLAGQMILEPYNYPQNIACCLGIAADKITKENQKQMVDSFAQALACSHIVGLKVYAGYQPYDLLDWRYLPFYDLAAQMQGPVVIHAGDTANSKGLLKYAHPLLVDELAGHFPQTFFVIAHYGSPWLADAAEVVCKNKNTAIDLSGLLAGPIDPDTVWREQEGYFSLIRTWNQYMAIYDRLLYGSDWPLVPMAPYIEIMSRLIPARFQEDVFYHNARRIFTRIQPYTE